MGDENPNTDPLTDQVLRDIIEEALKGVRENLTGEVSSNFDSDEEVSAYAQIIADAIRERLTPERVGSAFDEHVAQDDVQGRIRDGGITQDEISTQRQAAIDLIGGMLNGSLSSSVLEDTIKSHVQAGLAEVPGLVDEAINRHVEASIDRAAEARQRMFNTMANQPSLPDEQQLNEIERNMMYDAARKFAVQFAGIREADPEQYELYKDAFANSEIHQRAFEMVESGMFDNNTEDAVPALEGNRP